LTRVPLDDRGLLLGDGLFETLLWSNRALILADAHTQRMIRGAAELGLPPPSPEAFVRRAQAAVWVAGLRGGRAAVRVTLTAGSGGRGVDRPAEIKPRLLARAAAAERPTTPASLIVASSVRRNECSPASRLKTLAYLDNVLARREARVAGADEAAMLNTRGEIACAAVANIFWVKDDVLFTPAPEAGRLDGIMAGAVIDAAHELGTETRQVLAPASALEDADAIFLTNSLIGVRAAHLAGRPPPQHPLLNRLAAAVAPLV
jgi:branched-subunit amino acid aminotransferase/4-amino-4-deoxychorismate lyase